MTARPWTASPPRILVLLAVAGLAMGSLHAFETGVPLKLVIIPSSIQEEDATRATVKVRVTLRAPAPCYFICELRSSDRRQLSLADIIFRKGDIEGVGTGTIDWSEVPADGSIKVQAFSTDAPDQKVEATVALHRKQQDAL